MGKLPNVTIGIPSGQGPGQPSVTFGTPTGQGLPPVTVGTPTSERPKSTIGSAPKVNRITLQQALDASPDTPVFTIKELTGPQERTVILGNRALPYRGLAFESQMRIDEGEYTGYPRIAQTVLGAKELDTEISGTWKDRFLNDGERHAQIEVITPSEDDAIEAANVSLRTARDLCELFEDIAYSGRPLRVTWMHIRRIGRLEKFRQNWLNPHDVEWKMTFKWIGRDEQIGIPAPAQSTLIGLSSAFSAAYTDVHAATNFDGLDDLDPDFADAVDAAVGQIQRAVIDIRDAVESRVAAVTDPLDAIRRATTLSTFVRDQAQELIDTLNESVPQDMLVNEGAITPGEPADLSTLEGVDPGATFAAACQQRAAVRMARLLRHIAARQRFSALRSLDSNVVATVVLHDDQDLRDLSRRFYGTPGDAEKIRKFNGFTSYSPPSGTLVFVPAENNT
jgi:hypothetical protein